MPGMTPEELRHIHNLRSLTSEQRELVDYIVRQSLNRNRADLPPNVIPLPRQGTGTQAD